MDKVERLEREDAGLGLYSLHLAVGLSLVFSLTVVAIISKKNLTNYFLVDLAAFAVPITIALYFKDRIALLGAFTHATALIFFLAAAILFGV